jgi:hypothetical protein
MEPESFLECEVASEIMSLCDFPMAIKMRGVVTMRDISVEVLVRLGVIQEYFPRY